MPLTAVDSYIVVVGAVEVDWRLGSTSHQVIELLVGALETLQEDGGAIIPLLVTKHKNNHSDALFCRRFSYFTLSQS